MAQSKPFDLDDLNKRMRGAVQTLKQEFSGLRTGRASVSLLWLGPEPILPPQSLVLTQGDGSRGSVRVASDGLRAFGTSP
jgi:hypothetical protein